MSAASELVVKVGVIPTADYTWEYDSEAGDSMVKSTLRYKDNYSGWIERVPEENTEHPDIPGMKLVKIKAIREEGDLIAVTLSYESTDFETAYPGRPAREASLERFLADPNLNDEPLLTHPKFAALDPEYQEAISEYANSDRSEEDYATAAAICTDAATGLEFLNALRKGQDSWRAPNVIWSRKRIVKSLSEIPFASIGQITSVPKDPDNKPADVEGFNWMYLAPDLANTADGLAYEVTEYWERSYQGGWNAYFYAPPA
jgi:hypothetical protein